MDIPVEKYVEQLEKELLQKTKIICMLRATLEVLEEVLDQGVGNNGNE